MARARNIKPGFFANEELVELPFATRLLFIGLWTIADRAGRIEDKPKRIKMALFPADNLDIDEALNELQSAGFLSRYEHGESRYIQVLAFGKHQNPHKDEKASLIPAEGLHGASTVQAPCNEDADTVAIGLIPDSLIPDTGFPLTDPKRAAGTEEYPPDFKRAWDCYPKRPGASKKESFKAWTARKKAGVSVLEMMDGVHRYSAFVLAKQTAPDYIKQPATFFGPGEHYKSDWTVQPQARGSPPTQSLDETNRLVKEKLFGKKSECINV